MVSESVFSKIVSSWKAVQSWYVSSLAMSASEPTRPELLEQVNKGRAHDTQMVERHPKDMPHFLTARPVTYASYPHLTGLQRTPAGVQGLLRVRSLTLALISYEADPSHMSSPGPVFSAVKWGSPMLSRGLSSISINFHDFYKQAQTEQ